MSKTSLCQEQFLEVFKIVPEKARNVSCLLTCKNSYIFVTTGNPAKEPNSYLVALDERL